MDKKELKQKSACSFKSNLYIILMLLLVFFVLIYVEAYKAESVWTLVFGGALVAILLTYFGFTLKAFINIIIDRHRGQTEEVEGWLSHVVPNLLHEASFFMRDKNYTGLKFREDPKTKYKLEYEPDFIVKKGTKVKITYFPKSKIVMNIELLQDWDAAMIEAMKPIE